ncbi:MAG TPA: zinc-binding dehydrogenase [Firmicutes bacterium]|nr:zinc-binding dehydrogenase [Candidatus Fermentithermobacillaceae bacterium]
MSIKSKAVVMVEPRKVEIREVEVPEPATGQVLIRQHACALCTMEQRMYAGITNWGYGGVWGHEVSGVVEAIGPGTVTELKVGDHVALSGSGGCGTCYYCSIGLNRLCAVTGIGRSKAFDPESGKLIEGSFGLSEYAVANVTSVVKMSPDLPFEEACFIEPVACVVQSTNKLDIRLGQTVVVIGAGTMGILNMILAKLRGAYVIVSDLDPERRKKALELAAHAEIDPAKGDVVEQLKALNDGRGADIVVTAVGNRAVNEDALRMVGPEGKIMLFASAHPAAPLTLDPNVVHRTGICVTGTVSKNRIDSYQAGLLLSRRLINVAPLIETTFPLERVDEALALAADNVVYRVVVTI